MRSFKTKSVRATHAGWREIGSIRKYFRSRWEANYGRYLEWLKANGAILEWQHEAKTFWFEGIKRGCVSYLPDFEVKSLNNTLQYHEVKGWMDPKSKTKLKRMAKYHPSVKVLVITKRQYQKLDRLFSRMIEGWE